MRRERERKEGKGGWMQGRREGDRRRRVKEGKGGWMEGRREGEREEEG